MSHIPLSRIKANQKVDLWDCGPKRPESPEPPKAIDASLSGSDRAVAEVEFEDAMEAYKQRVREFGAAKKDHRDWHETNGGPKKVELWAVDARHALTIDADRFKLDLPKGQKPGRAQVEAEEKAAAEAEAAQREQSLDPQFGQGAA